MRVLHAVDERDLTPDLPCTRETVVGETGAEGAAVQVGCEVRDGGGDARVEGAAVGEVAAETHARGADATGAGG